MTTKVSPQLPVTLDAFAQGDNRLVNYKTYYFMAMAYGYNHYEALRSGPADWPEQAVQSVA